MPNFYPISTLGFDIDVYDVNGIRQTDFDIILPEAIIEVKTGQNADPSQTATQVAYSDGKPVIVFGPQITSRAAKQLLRNAGATETVNTVSDLDAILQAIRNGITDPNQLDAILKKLHPPSTP